jgi:hypothetical protein
LSKDHPLSSKGIILPKDLDGFRIAVPEIKLVKPLQLVLKNTGINADFEETESDRYVIIEFCNKGYIYFLNESIAKTFPEFACIPFDFDTHVQTGLACHNDMVESYRAFFSVARKISDGVSPHP